MDNVSFHKKTVNIIKNSGNHILFIPPYSPEFNPIEEVFSHLKAYVKKYITPLHQQLNITEIVKMYVNEQYCTTGYYRHAFGKYNYG